MLIRGGKDILLALKIVAVVGREWVIDIMLNGLDVIRCRQGSRVPEQMDACEGQNGGMEEHLDWGRVDAEWGKAEK